MLLSFPTPWSAPSGDIALSCPPAPPGVPPDLYGVYDPGPIKNAFMATGWATLLLVFSLVLLCYLATNMSTGPRFQWRWWGFLAGTATLSFVLPLLTLPWWPTHALQGSCENSPEPFAASLPWDLILARAFAGII